MVLRRFSNAPIPDDALTGRAQEQITNSYGPLCKFLERQRQAQLVRICVCMLCVTPPPPTAPFLLLGGTGWERLTRTRSHTLSKEHMAGQLRRIGMFFFSP